MALSNHLRSVLPALNVNSEYMDHIIQILITDNLDLGCAVIENVASEKVPLLYYINFLIDFYIVL